MEAGKTADHSTKQKIFQMEEIILAKLEAIERNSLLALTGLSKSYLYKLTSQRQIPFYRRAKQLYFDREELEGWLLQNRISTEAEAEAEAVSYVTRNMK